MSALRECIRRAVRTFLQAAFGYAAASLAGLVESGGFTKNTLAALLTAAVAAGLAAVMNIAPRRAANYETKEDYMDE